VENVTAEQKKIVSAEELEKVKKKIAKLKAMAADASSPEEAGIAAGQYRKLLDKYQLDEFDASGVLDEVFGTMYATGFLSGTPTYMSTLAVSIARYNYCHAKYEYGQNTLDPSKRGQAVQFLGFKSDVEMAVDMYKSLTATINRLCKEYMTAKGHKVYDAKIGAQFKRGAASAIIATVNELTVERGLLTSDVTGTSLVLAKEKAVEAEFGVVNYTAGRKQRKLTAAEQTAHGQGYIRGKAVEINKRID
jgi:Protein of unknown function (DUF2786)